MVTTVTSFLSITTCSLVHFFDPGMDEMVSTVDQYVRQRLTETSR